MTRKDRPALKQVDLINAHLASPSTTTAQTLNLLRAVLGLDLQAQSGNHGSKAAESKHTKDSKPRGRMTGAPRRPTKKPAVAIREDRPAQAVILDSRARKDVATASFNTTLKTVSSAAKSAQEKTTDAGKAQKSTSKQRLASPLGECSPNRQAKQKPLKETAENTQQLESTVECAIVALEVLRQLETETNGTNAVDLRLEQGALVLLDKTITLGMSSLAECQLRRLHEQYWKRRKVSASTASNCGEAGTVQLPLVVDFNADKALLKFATSLQSHFLRLAILKGPKIIDVKFIEAMRPESPGGPANAVIEGFRLGHIDKESCGMQLRTISLALSKLYSIPKEKTTAGSPSAAALLQLACIALQIKVHSWKYLGHKADFQKELWVPVKKHIQRYMATKLQAVTTDLPEECVKLLRSTLSPLGFEDDLPSDMQSLVERHPASKMSKTARVDDTTRNVLCQLDITANRLEAYSTQPEAVVESLGELSNVLVEQKIISRATLPTIFLGVARVRKALLSASTSVEQNVAIGKASQNDLQLQVACIRTIYSFGLLVLRCIQPSTSQDKNSTPALRHTLPEHDLALPFAKTAEAVLVTDTFAITRSAILNGEAVEALQWSFEDL